MSIIFLCLMFFILLFSFFYYAAFFLTQHKIVYKASGDISLAGRTLLFRKLGWTWICRKCLHDVLKLIFGLRRHIFGSLKAVLGRSLYIYIWKGASEHGHPRSFCLKRGTNFYTTSEKSLKHTYFLCFLPHLHFS